MGGNVERRRGTGTVVFWACITLLWLPVLLPLLFCLFELVGGLHARWRTMGADGWAAGLSGFASAAFWGAGLHTLLVSAIAVAAALGVALPASFALVKCRMPASGAGWGAVVLLACVPGYVTVGGMVDACGLAWLIDPGAPHRAVIAAGLIGGMVYAPFAVVGAAGAWLRAGREEEEAGLLAAPPHRVWLAVTLPACAPGVAATAMMTALLAAYDITGVDALAVRSWAEEVYLAFNLDLNPGSASVATLPLAVTAMVCAASCLRWGGGMACPLLTGNETRPYRYRLVRSLPLLLAAGAAVVGVLFLPLVSLVATGLGESDKSPHWPGVLRSALLTAGCAGAGAALALFLALPAAWHLVCGRSRPSRVGLAAFGLALFALPGPLLGASLAGFWNHPWWVRHGLTALPELFYDTPAVVVTLHAQQCLPPALFLAAALFRGLPGECFDAAGTLSVTPLRAAWRIGMPMAWRGCLGIWVVCYFLSLRELGGLILVAPPGMTFLAVRYATQIHFGIYGDLALLLAAAVPLVALPPALACFLFSKGARSR